MEEFVDGGLGDEESLMEEFVDGGLGDEESLVEEFVDGGLGDEESVVEGSLVAAFVDDGLLARGASWRRLSVAALATVRTTVVLQLGLRL